METDEFYFLTPDGTVHHATADVEGLAERACILLFTYDWVEIRAWQDRALMKEPNDETRRTRWSVISRSDGGAPLQIFIEEYDGSMKVGDLTIVNKEE